MPLKLGINRIHTDTHPPKHKDPTYVHSPIQRHQIQRLRKQEPMPPILGVTPSGSVARLLAYRKDGNPLVDGRLTVRRMRRVDRTVESMCDQVVEAIVCFGVPAPKGRGWF